MREVNWDTNRARQLLADGDKTDLEIAEMLGITIATLRSWKQRQGLTRARSKETAAAVAEDKEPQPEAAPQPDKKNAPEPVKPRITLGLCNCVVSIEAPNLTSARRVLELLHTIEQD